MLTVVPACSGGPTTPTDPRLSPSPSTAVTLASLTVSPGSVESGATAQGTVTISSAAGTGGAAVMLSSDQASVQVPPSVSVAAGATSATFTVTTTDVRANTDARITASAGGATREATLRVTPRGVTVTIAAFEVSNDDLIGGENGRGTIRLGTAAGAGGVRITLTSSDEAVTLPASILIAAGAVEADFEIDTTVVPAERSVDITATIPTSGIEGTTARITIRLLPPHRPTLGALSPATAVQGQSVSITVTGTNMVAGATLAITESGVTVSDVQVASDTSMTATLTIAADAEVGAREIRVKTLGGTSGAQTFTVVAANRAPSADADGYVADKNSALNLAPPGVLDGDSDPDGDTLTAELVSGSSHGTVTLHANGSLTYTPTANFTGSDSFTYRTSDGMLTSDVATVTITVVNSAPVADSDAYTTNEDTPLTLAARGVLDGDTDTNGDALTAQIVSGPSSGALTLNANGSFTYTPSANFAGSDSFTYRASDGTLTSNTATATITVTQLLDDHTPFAYAGAHEDWMVPAGVTSIRIEASGAQGGSGGTQGTAAGGAGANGGTVIATITVTPGEVLRIFVGGQGGAGSMGTVGAAGFNGGGAGGEHGGGGGGGASDVRRTSYDLSDRLIVAGGGGGGGATADPFLGGGAGGAGGGTNGADGSAASNGQGGHGGKQGAGGNGGARSGSRGTSGFGGASADNEAAGGGGGGGYHGGGGGGFARSAPVAGGGGGGSSFTISGATDVTHTQGNRSGHGHVIIIW